MATLYRRSLAMTLLFLTLLTRVLDKKNYPKLDQAEEIKLKAVLRLISKIINLHLLVKYIIILAKNYKIIYFETSCRTASKLVSYLFSKFRKALAYPKFAL